MLDTAQKLKILPSMRWDDDVMREVQLMLRAGVVEKAVALAVVV